MTAEGKRDIEAVEFQTDSEISKRKLSLLHVIKAIAVRLLLMTHSLVTIWRTVDVLDDKWYWFLAAANVVLIIDGFFTIFRLKGQERKWYVSEIKKTLVYKTNIWWSFCNTKMSNMEVICITLRN